MANVALTSDSWTQISITSGTLQNISATADVEVSSEQTENSGVVIYPGQKYQWSNKTLYARATTEESAAIRVVNFKKDGEGGGSGGQSNYSTEEQRIGTWIDGKPLYQKTYSGTIPEGADSGNTDIIVDNTIGNIESGSIFVGYIIDSYNSHLQINQGTDGDAIFALLWLSIPQMSIRGRVSTSLISCPVIVTIQYTKTTD